MNNDSIVLIKYGYTIPINLKLPGLSVPLYLIIVLAGELCGLELERALRIVVERVVNIHGSVVPLVIVVDRVVNVHGSVIVAGGRKSRSRDGSWRIA